MGLLVLRSRLSFPLIPFPFRIFGSPLANFRWKASELEPPMKAFA